MPQTKSNESKVAYIYSAGSQTWHPIIGIASTQANYTWTGAHVFNDQQVTFEEVVRAQGGVNNFDTESTRDSVLGSTPDYGVVAFVRTVNGDNTANQIQYYNGTAWVNYADTSFVAKTSNYTIALPDSGKTVTINSGSAVTITVPLSSVVPFAIGTRIDFVTLGSGAVDFGTSAGVTLNSKNSWKKLNSQYSGATLMKTDTNTWVLIGDLKS